MLEQYRLLVSFLGESLGKNCEVVLHDVTNLEHSIVAIANGEISGREIGGPATDFLLKLLQVHSEKKVNYITNYFGKSYNGHNLRGSSYFIHEGEKLVGVLCINYDVNSYIKARDMLDQLILIDSNMPKLISDGAEDNASIETLEEQEISSTGIAETFYHTADDAIEHMIDKCLTSYNVDTQRLSAKERTEIVYKLYESGLFLLKGGISALAIKLGVSEPSVYRYLQEVKRRGKNTR